MKRTILGVDIREPFPVLGFAAHWVWIWCVFWSSLFYQAPDAMDAEALAVASALQGLEPLWTVSLGANVATIAVLLAVAGRRNPLARFTWLPVAAAAVTMLGTLLLSEMVLAAAGPGARVAYVAGSVLTGIGSAGVIVLWGELFSQFGVRETIVYSVLGVLAACTVHLVVMLLPTALAQALVSLFPGAGMALFVKTRKRWPRLSGDRRDRKVDKGSVPRRMILIAAFFGFSFGVMKGLMAPLPQELLGMRDTLNIVAIVAGALLILLTSSVLRLDFNQLTYQIALPLMAAGFLFVPLQGVFAVLGTAVHQCGYQYFYIVLWATWPIIAQRADLPSGWVAANGLCFIQLGQLIGSIGAALLASVLVQGVDRAMFSAAAIFIMLLVALFVFGNKTVDTGWGFVRPADAEPSRSPFDEAIERLARARRLTPRETEVFLLLAKGRNRSYIARELVIGDETVKSHIKCLYRKLDVHSQQELIDLLESQIESAERGNALAGA